MSCCHTDGPLFQSIRGSSATCSVSALPSWAFSSVYHIPSSLVCLLTLFFCPHFDLTHFALLFLISASIAPLFFGISVSFAQMVLSTPLLSTRLSIPLFPATSPPFPFRLVSSCLILSWCFSFRQLMENKITTIERGAFQDLKELERL